MGKKTQSIVRAPAQEGLPTLFSAERVSQSLQGHITGERVTELAEAGFMPHYRVDGKLLFRICEVKDYVRRELMTRSHGMPVPRELHVPVTGFYKAPPDVIAQLPGIEWLSPVSHICGIYFLVHQGDVIYVGQSVNVVARLPGHKGKEHDDVFFLRVPQSELDVVEAEFIRILKPPLNVSLGQNASGSGIPLSSKTNDLLTGLRTANVINEQKKEQ